MNQSLIIGLLQNASILLAFAVLYDLFSLKKDGSKPLLNQFGVGLILGILGIILIATPWTLVPGITFDTRSILLSVTGLFFGPLPTLVAVVLTGAYRIYLGGNGIFMGLAVIVSSAGVGLLWRHFRPRWDQKKYWAELLSMGFVVHALMILCSFLLPAEIVFKTIKTIALPVIIVYPLVTLLLGTVVQFLLKSQKNKHDLHSSEERWKFALEGSGDGVWDWNVETNEVFFSKRWKNMLGFEEDEIGNTLTEWEKRVHPDDKEIVYADLNRHFEKKTPYYINEHRVLCKDGSYKWILDRGKVMSWSANKKPARVIGTHTDISERKKAEEEIRMYASVVATSADMMAILDKNFCYKAANESYLKAFNIEREKIIGFTPDILFGKEFFEQTIKPNAQKCLNGEIVNYQEWFKFSKSDKYMDITFYPYYNSKQNIDGFIVNTRDLTERKLAEKALLNEKNLLSTIIKNIPVMLTRYDPNSEMLYLNKEFEEKIGWKSEDLESIDLMEQVYPDPDYRQYALEYMQQASEEWREFRVQSKSGAVIDSEWCNIHLDDGTQIGIGIDLTREKKAAEVILKLNEELEQKVEERTQELGTKISQIERINRLFVGRELRMKELKEKIKDLEEKLEEQNK